MIDLDSLDKTPIGPFFVIHNGESIEFGFDLKTNGSSIVFSNGSRTYGLDETYESNISEDGYVVFHSDTYDSTFEIRELTLDDVEYAYGIHEIDRFSTLEEFKEQLYTDLQWSSGSLGEAEFVDQPDVTFSFTIDDDGNILELIKSDDEGVWVRENGDWILTDSNDPNDTIWDKEWLDVSEDAIKFWDESQNDEEPISRDRVVKYSTAS